MSEHVNKMRKYKHSLIYLQEARRSLQGRRRYSLRNDYVEEWEQLILYRNKEEILAIKGKGVHKVGISIGTWGLVARIIAVNNGGGLYPKVIKKDNNTIWEVELVEKIPESQERLTESEAIFCIIGGSARYIGLDYQQAQDVIRKMFYFKEKYPFPDRLDVEF